ncbi:MAG TPA: response regulator [Candidatus Limnocylindrales bacterium]|nr:response regulator [Candidatus Limnocylindrales bacterium]
MAFAVSRDGRVSILLVEDSENSAAMLEIALQDIPGVELVAARSGIDALRHLRLSPVDAVITDLNMPRMDGFELISRIRDDEALSHIPVVVVSADTDPATPRRLSELGVQAYFPKPYSPAQVRRTVEQLLDVPAR